jgi:CBS domain-containing protein
VNERPFDLVELLAGAAVPVSATVEEAARELAASGVAAIAVLNGPLVKGMFTEDDLLRAAFPGYLSELKHTSFVDRDTLLAPHLQEAAAARVTEFMHKPELVTLPTSALDIAQRFLHSDSAALIATSDGAFVGVIDQTRFCTAILRRYGWQL